MPKQDKKIVVDMDLLNKILTLIKRPQGATREEIEQTFNVSRNSFANLILRLTWLFPIYEEKRTKKRLVYKYLAF